eukprot:TRINITY_DN1496_c2_g1_i1.p1 TRINITY_DN1496_c2_g1~~TRINITY_DN1496_c2_g1_i1.p1  ORF type:complete len:346 (-),score=7.60 TRINITY_DN1496_c2_g1_i1:418-1455(-)
MAERKGWLGIAALLISVVVVGMPGFSRADISYDKSVRYGLVVRSEEQLDYFLRASEPQEISELGGSEFNISGRTFYSRVLEGRRVAMVSSGIGMINAATAAETLLMVFRGVSTLFHYDFAASPKLQLNLGDIVVREHYAHAGNWYWQKRGSSEEAGLFDLRFVDYTINRNPLCQVRDNELNRIWVRTTEVVSAPTQSKNVFWVNSTRTSVPQVELEQCDILRLPAEWVCLEKRPVVVEQSWACSGEIYVDNQAYAEFLGEKVNCDAIDMSTFGVVQVAVAHEIGLYSLATVSGRGGIPTSERVIKDTSFHRLSYRNIVKLVHAIFKTLPKESPSHIAQVVDKKYA